MAGTDSVSWGELLGGIQEAFSSDSVDVDEVKRLLSSYRSRREDWQPFAKFDTHRYTRNLVDGGNGRYNLIIICWGEGHASSIHDHANSHCFMRVMEGSLQEIQYAWPASSQSRGQPVTELNKRDLVTDEVTYINDSIGLHRIQNISHTDPAISLHLYSPPITTCHTFEQRTGRAHSCTVSFFSRNGSVCSNYSTCSASAS